MLLAFLKESKPWTFHKRFFQRAAIAWGGCELIQTKKGVKLINKIKTGKMTLRQDRCIIDTHSQALQCVTNHCRMLAHEFTTILLNTRLF
jgi:hypothetical protein